MLRRSTVISRFWRNKRTPEGLAKSIELLEKAIEIDPKYALAHAGQAETFVLVGIYSHRPHDVMPKMLAAANRAIELDPLMAAPHSALGLYFFHYAWDWDAAEASFLRAIEIDPNYATAHHWYADFLAFHGRADEAKPFIERAVTLEPGSMIIQRDRGHPDHYARRFEDARRHYEAALAMDPSVVSTNAMLGGTLLALGRLDEAIERLKIGVLSDGASSFSLGMLGYAYGLAGRRDEALGELQRLDDLSATRYVPHSTVAFIHIGLGDLDRAFALFDLAFEEREFTLSTIKFDPSYDEIRNDPRFDALLKRVGFLDNPPAPVVDP